MAEHIQIGDVSPRIQYSGDGAQTQFTYPFPVFKDTDMEAYIDGALQTLTTDYTVAGAGNSNGGTVTFVSPPANDATLTLRRRMTIQRTSDFQESGEFRAKVINDDLDILTACVQQVQSDAARSLHLSPSDSASSLEIPDKPTRSNKALAFDSNGDPTAADLTGPEGPQGPAGNDGSTWRTGSGAPSDVLGNNGDFYMDTANDVYYGPKAAGSWPTPGTSIVGPAGAGSGDMIASNNLSDLANAATARSNLGLGAIATESTAPLTKGGTGATDAATARTNLGLGSIATENTAPIAKGGTGATTAATARTNLGLGALATQAAGTGLVNNGGDTDLDINGLTAETVVDGANDYLAMYDASAAAVRKVKADDLGGGGGGAMVWVETLTASGSSSLDFEAASLFDGTYDRIVFIGSEILPVTAGHLWVRVKEGGSYKSGAADYVQSAGTAAQIQASTNGFTNAAGYANGFTLTVDHASSSSQRVKVHMTGAESSVTANCWGAATKGGMYAINTNAIAGIQFRMAAGNITSGVIRAYGVSKS